MSASCINDTEWIRLTTGKEYSRLLYTNPVCFLCTINQSATSENVATDRKEQPDKDATENTPTDEEHKTPIKRNVMVLSWLTPTNNQGHFTYSIHKSRYSASLLAPLVDSKQIKTGVEFSLCVPIKGMEQLVLDVGSVSGRFGSKFPSAATSLDECYKVEESQLSNRQRKKMKKEQFSLHGIPGLVPVCLGSSTPETGIKTDSDLFAVQGTVAHLHCRTCAVIGTSSSDAQSGDMNQQTNSGCEENITKSRSIDNDHLLIMAEVIDTFVQSSYWDKKKLLFRPQSVQVAPYLTFFGSQTFGYVGSSLTSA